MIVVLAEKPSVARELATLLDASARRDGYFEGNGYSVTWAIGHLVGLALPQEYGIVSFARESLPVLPRPYKLTPRTGSGTKAGKADKAAVRQLAVIKRLFTRCDSIIVATDAGREGELIFRYIYEYTGCTKPFQRLWVSSLTQKALKAGFDNLMPGTNFDTMYLAARARSRADWLIGINATQALTVAAGGGVYSLGRVQTPTLGLICKRYEEHHNFKKDTYWELQMSHTKSFVDFQSSSVLRWNNLQKAEEALKSVCKVTTAEVVSVEKKSVTEEAPLLFDLTGLQKLANSKFGFSASETLNIAQALYEKQFISYPRTGSRHITPDLWTEVPKLIRNLQAADGFGDALSKVRMGKLNKHIVDESKVTDHHGLLVTEKIPSALSAKEASIYKLIGLRLLEAVSEASIREIAIITLQALHYEFISRSSTIRQAGWRDIQNDYADAQPKADSLPEFTMGDQVKITDVILTEERSQPPQLFNDATLLAAMESVEGLPEDHTHKEALKGIGLGTPATRAGIIESLLRRGYIERKAKALFPTAKGRMVYNIVAGMDIASAAMTAEWEAVLERIEQGTYSDETFLNALEAYTGKITRELLKAKVIREEFPELLCPKCKEHSLQMGERVIQCPDEACGWRQYRNVCGVVLSVANIEHLVQGGQTGVINGMKSKSGKLFSARLLLDSESRVIFSF